MLGYRKRSFTEAFALLEALRANKADFTSLKKLQQLLLREIVRAEKKIRNLKAEQKGVQKAGGKQAAKRSSQLKVRIERYRQNAYIWRCFGDAIAFLYMDKHALKQVFFNVMNRNPKNTAGFILGKDGLAMEIAHLEYALEQKVPSLLTDLTNTIRHGDICLMDGPDPYLIEVKVGNKLDRRGKKQKRNIEVLHGFFENDKARGLRGIQAEIRRQEFQTPERTYVVEIGDCIAEAIKQGHATRQPESGLYYIAFTKDISDISQILAPLKVKEPWLFQLNEFKATRAWAPYSPFTLTLQNKENLWAFIEGNVVVLVLFDLERLTTIAKEKGYDAKLEPDSEGLPEFKIQIPDAGGYVGPSAQFLARIPMEFVSPDWLVTASIEMLVSAAQAQA
ncbi:MAG: hypothetical protein J0H78_19630 [Rhizobiales bacterium]|nr:hypothetical protein [Hyphomicrobiales bacterium]OJY43886.1 MAG: hypothetical protein BGP08_14945 [Rhizobiales bacterium 64-17]